MIINDLNSSLCSVNESLLNFLPVHNLPDILKEVSLSMLVVNVEGVFPNVDIQERRKATWLLVSDEILVDSGTILKRLGMLIVN